MKRFLLRAKILLTSIYFNFRFLPYKQAVKLPILLCNPKFINLSGRVIINTDKVYRGMIKLGYFSNRVSPNNGIQICNEGVIEFKGKCSITNNSYLFTGKNGHLIIGNNTSGGPVKIVSNIGVELGEGTRIGWDVTIIDSSFHPLYDMENKRFKKAYGKIKIGDYNWISQQCLVFHSVETPQRCIFGARSVVNRGAKFESYCVHGGSPLKVISRNIMRDLDNDQIYDYR